MVSAIVTCNGLRESHDKQTPLYILWRESWLFRTIVCVRLIFLSRWLIQSSNKFTGQNKNPAGSSVNSAFFEGFYNDKNDENIFEAYTNGQYIWHKNNTTQFYCTCILGTARLHWNFSNILKDAPDIHWLSNRKWILTMCIIGNL